MSFVRFHEGETRTYSSSSTSPTDFVMKRANEDWRADLREIVINKSFIQSAFFLFLSFTHY